MTIRRKVHARSHGRSAASAWCAGLLAVVASACSRTQVVTTRYDDGSPSMRVELRGRLRDGSASIRHPHGAAASESTYHAGLLDGPVVTWHDNGVRASVGTYDDGRRVGEWTEFAPNGVRVLEGHYVDGDKDGSWREYDEAGRLVAEERWKRGTRAWRALADLDTPDANGAPSTPDDDGRGER